MQREYLPEGMREPPGARAVYYSRSALESAMAEGRILEAPAVLCDGSYDLTVDLGSMHGVIRREEVVDSTGGSAVKDIAVITRVGKTVCFCVTGFFRDKEGRTCAALSRRLAQRQCRQAFLSKLRVGDVTVAKVTHMEKFGAFVDIGCGIVSLLCVDCISVSRIEHPRDRFFSGMQIYVVIRSVDRESGRISVSHKELLGTWEENAAQFLPGQTVTGIVRSIEEYGIFVELTPNLAGLSELREGAAVGQNAAVYIKSILPDRMKIKLALIDTYKAERAIQPLPYRIRSGHIDRFVYSPPCCDRIIETLFEDDQSRS